MALYDLPTLKRKVNQTSNQLQNESLNHMLDFMSSSIHRLARTSLNLNAAGNTTIYTTPGGYQTVVDRVEFVGRVAQTGANKGALVKLGSAANSYNELLDQGVDFETNDEFSILPVGVPKVILLDKRPRLLARKLVPLTATGQTTLYTVPTGSNVRITDVILEGHTAISGGTSSTVKIGTTANSYVELLNGGTGITFTSGTATSLVPVGGRVRGNDAGLSSNSLVSKPDFTSTTVIRADVSGTVVTAGQVYVELWGYLDTDGPKIISQSTPLIAVVAAGLGGSVPDAGQVYVDIYGRLLTGAN